MENLSEKTRCGNCQHSCYIDYFYRVCVNPNSSNHNYHVEQDDYCPVWELKKITGPRRIWKDRTHLEPIKADIDERGNPFILKKHIDTKVPYCSECGKRMEGIFLHYCDNCGVKFEGDENE